MATREAFENTVHIIDCIHGVFTVICCVTSLHRQFIVVGWIYFQSIEANVLTRCKIEVDTQAKPPSEYLFFIRMP